MNKILTIAIAAYNVESYISKTLDSLLIKEKLDELEIIIVNDGSTDNIIETVSKYTEKYPNSIQLISKQNEGCGSAWKCSLKKATGKYFKILDGDDWVITDNLLSLIKLLEVSDEDLILSNHTNVYELTDKSKFVSYIDVIKYGIMDMDNIEYPFLIAIHDLVTKTELLKDYIEKISNGFYTDIEYIVYSIIRAQTLKYINLDITQYRIGRAEQSVSISSMKKHIKEAADVSYKVFNFYQQFQGEISDSKRKMILEPLSLVVYSTYKALLSFDYSKVHKRKICNYLDLFKESDVERKLENNKILYLLVNKNRWMYGLICQLYKLYLCRWNPFKKYH